VSVMLALLGCNKSSDPGDKDLSVFANEKGLAMKLPNVWVLALTLGLLNLVAGCSPSPNTKPAGESKPIKIQVEAIRPQEVRSIARMPGTVRSVLTAPLASKVMGSVLEVRVRAGDRVKAGQLLVVIDSRETEAMVRKSEAGLQEAQMALLEIKKTIEATEANVQLASATLKRYEQLATQKSVSLQELEEVQARQRSALASLEGLQARKQQALSRIEQAQSDLNSSQALRSYTEIRSPFHGVITQRQAEPGALAVPGMPLLIVEDTSRYRLEVPFEESRLTSIKAGQAIAVQIEATGLANLKGSVSEVEPSTDSASRTYLVKINLPANRQLRSGMYGEALLEGQPRQAICIRPGSIVRNGQLEGVYVVEGDSMARLRLLKLGETTSAGIEVLSGLSGGEVCVVQGIERLQDGSRVEVSAVEHANDTEQAVPREVSR
jgi:RND family efflux transporter MFP subunit